MNETQYLFSSKNPAEYITRSLEVKLSSGKKAVITRAWLKKTGHTIEEIQYARHRNSYWKKRKLAGNYERNLKRISMHVYSSGERIEWNKKRLGRFVELTDQKHDYELAKYFRTTIPSIQYLRRKYHAARLILSGQGNKNTVRQLVDLMSSNEKKLFELARRYKRR